MFTASRDRSVRAWKLGLDDVALQTHAHTGHQDFVNAIVYVPARNGVGAHVVTGGGDKRLLIWMVDDPLWPVAIVENAHEKNICTLALAPNGILSGSWDQLIII